LSNIHILCQVKPTSEKSQCDWLDVCYKLKLIEPIVNLDSLKTPIKFHNYQ